MRHFVYLFTHLFFLFLLLLFALYVLFPFFPPPIEISL